MEADPCPLCRRPNYSPSDHHLVPKSRGGTETRTLCSDCHKTVHAFFTNRELESTYSTVDALMSHPGFRGAIRFVSRQDGYVRVRKTRSRRARR